MSDKIKKLKCWFLGHDWQILPVCPHWAESKIDDWCVCRRCNLRALVDPDGDMWVPADQLKELVK